MTALAEFAAAQRLDAKQLYSHLERAKQAGVQNIERIVRDHAIPRGWPAELARKYLTENLRYDVGPREIEAIRRFHDLAADEGIIPTVRELNALIP